MSNPPVNGHDPLQPDLSTPQARELWARTHGLPKGFLIISEMEMFRISQTVQMSSSENLKYRAVARIQFNAKSPIELTDAINNVKRIHKVTSQERDKYRLALVEMAKAGNVVAKNALL